MPAVKYAFMVAALSVTVLSAAEADPVQWRTEFAPAAIEAQKQGKPLFISIHTQWCGPCKEMHRTTLHDPSIVGLLNGRCVPLLLDGDRSKELMNQWRVSAYPTHMIVGTSGAAKGQVLERIDGKVGARDLMDALQRAVQKQANAVAAAKPDPARSQSKTSPRPGQEMTTQAAARGPLKPPSPSDAEGVVKPAAFKAPEDSAAAAALGGHCPVCMIERAEMVTGKKAETTVHNGRTYQFSSAENKRRFLEAPTKFLPGAGGDCVVTLVDSGKRAAGDMKYPALFGEKVYFFADKAAREKFLKDADAFVDSKGEPRPPKGK